MSRVAAIARQASAHGLRARKRLIRHSRSEQARHHRAGWVPRRSTGDRRDPASRTHAVRASASGSVIQSISPMSTPLSTSFNRNFPKRNDGNANTKAFLTSPDMVLLYALAGTLDFDPLSGTVKSDSGESVTFEPPMGEDLPTNGYDRGRLGYMRPPAVRSDIAISVDPESDRLQLRAVSRWDGHDYLDLPVLLKARGKCTTDQISAAGKWLRYRGHLRTSRAISS